MKRFKFEVVFSALLFVFWVILVSAAVGVAADIPKLNTPAVITSLGQSPDAYCVSVLAKRAKLSVGFEKLISAENLEGYKTLLMTVGASLKGFGSAGVNLDTEIARGKRIIKTAKDKHIFLVVVHSGGVGRRESMSDKLLNVVAKEADFLLIYKESNKDGYFTDVAKKYNIPIEIVNKVIDMQSVLKEMFLSE